MQSIKTRCTWLRGKASEAVWRQWRGASDPNNRLNSFSKLPVAFPIVLSSIKIVRFELEESSFKTMPKAPKKNTNTASRAGASARSSGTKSKKTSGE